MGPRAGYAAAASLLLLLPFTSCGGTAGKDRTDTSRMTPAPRTFKVDVTRKRLPRPEQSFVPTIQPGLETIYANAKARFDTDRAAFDPNTYRTRVDTYTWHESYLLEAFVAAYEGSGDARYLERISRDIDIVLGHRADKLGIRDELRGRVLAAWAKPDQEGRMYCWLVNAGMLIAPISRWAYLVDRDPALRAVWGQKADQYLLAAVETLNAFEDEWRETLDHSAGHYVFLQGERYRERQPPLELTSGASSVMGRAFVNLWLITGDPEFRARAEKLANDLRGQIRTDQGAAAWPYWNIPSYRNGVVDISHGQLDVDFIFQCHRAGITFTRDEVNRIVRTFRRSTLRDERGRLRGWTNFIDGTGKKLNFREGSLDFWSRLAQLDPEIARTLWEGMPFYRQVQPMRMAGLLMMGCTRFRFDPVLCAERSDGPGGSPGLAGAAGCP